MNSSGVLKQGSSNRATELSKFWKYLEGRAHINTKDIGKILKKENQIHAGLYFLNLIPGLNLKKSIYKPAKVPKELQSQESSCIFHSISETIFDQTKSR